MKNKECSACGEPLLKGESPRRIKGRVYCSSCADDLVGDKRKPRRKEREYG